MLAPNLSNSRQNTQQDCQACGERHHVLDCEVFQQLCERFGVTRNQVETAQGEANFGDMIGG